MTNSRTPGELLAGIRHRGTMGLPQSSTRGQSASPAYRLRGTIFSKFHTDTTRCTAHRQRPSRQHTGLAEQRTSRSAHAVHTTSSRRLNAGTSCVVSTAATRASRLHGRLRAAPLRPAASRQPRGTPSSLPPSSHKKHAPTQTCSLLILRADRNRRRRDRAFQQQHVPVARGVHQHEGFPTNCSWYSPFDVSTPDHVVPPPTAATRACVSMQAPRRPSPAGGLPASQEVRRPYFSFTTKRASTYATLLMSS